MSFRQPDLTAGSRPILATDEALLFVQNNVGVYAGKYKVADLQVGHAYLTSHRICYVDDKDPRGNSLSLDLKDVEKYEYQAGFLRSSPKITIHLRLSRKSSSSSRYPSLSIPHEQRLQVSSSSPVSRTGSPLRSGQIQKVAPPVSSGSWICPICTYTNPVPSNFNPSTATEATAIPPCLTCGIPPPFSLVLKAAISANTQGSAEPLTPDNATVRGSPGSSEPSESFVVCPKCTFHNHPSLQICEICGTALPVKAASTSIRNSVDGRTASPAPEISHLSIGDAQEEPTSIKISFRSGGDRVFYEKLKSAMVQRKWLASGVPTPNPLNHVGRDHEMSSSSNTGIGAGTPPRSGRVGIAALEHRGLQSQNSNQMVIGTAFEDLEALMALDKEVVALAQNLAREFGGSATDSSFAHDAGEETEQGMVATKDMFSSTSEKVYISELSRNLAEYVTDERRGVLRKQGGTISLIDLWATFNRSQDGVELVSPTDFHKAALMWADLGLPVRLKQFRSGLLAVQRSDMNDDKIISQLKRWLEGMRVEPLTVVRWDWQRYGCGVTAQDAAKRFGWSLGIATEELEMAEERGALCREESIEGLKFWLNYINEDSSDGGEDD